MKKSILSVFGLALVMGLSGCGNSTGSSSYEDDDTLGYDSGYLDSTGYEGGVNVEDDPNYNNSLETGDEPYDCAELSGSDSYIQVKASNSSDVVVIVKSYGDIVRNAYICAGDTHRLYVPNGTYQVFFYEGQGWDPEKVMSGGHYGGFVAYESFSKDESVDLEDQSLTYELIPQENGNFQTEGSDEEECF